MNVFNAPAQALQNHDDIVGRLTGPEILENSSGNHVVAYGLGLKDGGEAHFFSLHGSVPNAIQNKMSCERRVIKYVVRMDRNCDLFVNDLMTCIIYGKLVEAVRLCFSV